MHHRLCSLLVGIVFNCIDIVESIVCFSIVQSTNILLERLAYPSKIDFFGKRVGCQNGG